jgi:hypothetical protein
MNAAGGISDLRSSIPMKLTDRPDRLIFGCKSRKLSVLD